MTAAALLFAGWICLCSLCGWQRVWEPPPDMDGQKIACEGIVCGVEEKEGTQYLYLNHLKNISQTELSVKYQLKIIPLEPVQVKYGNRVSVRGKALLPEAPSNEGQFDSLAWQRAQRILFTVKKAEVTITDSRCQKVKQKLSEIRHICEQRFLRILPEKDAGVLSAMLTGSRTYLDENLKTSYQLAGIAHILAISGLHISLIGMFLYRCLRKMGGSFGTAGVCAGAVMLLYTEMTGNGAASCRAVLMFLVFLGAQYAGRTYDLASALSFAVILLLFSNPLLLFTAGFQLSVLAVFGLACLHPVLTQVYGKKTPSGLAIQLMTLPCVLWHFYLYPLYGIGLNLLVLPLMPFVLAGGIALLGLSFFWMPAAYAAGAAVHKIFVFYETICQYSLRLPFASLTVGRPPVWAVLFYYSILFFGTALLVCEKQKQFKKGLPLLLLCACCMLRPPEFSGFWISFLDVGQGDCIYFQNEQGVRFLCDGGSSSVGKVGQYRILPFLRYHGVSCLDYVMLTHMDADHINGVKELLEMAEGSVKIGTLILPKMTEPDDTYHEMETLARKRGIAVRYLCAGDSMASGKLKMTCLHPDRTFRTKNKNEASLTLHVQYGTFDVILTGDLEKDGEAYLLARHRLETLRENGNQMEVLKVGHHGSKGAASEKLLDVLKPQLAVLSYGKNNRYGHPAPETTERLEKSGCRIVSTEKQGEITIFCDKNEKITIRYRKNVIK